MGAQPRDVADVSAARAQISLVPVERPGKRDNGNFLRGVSLAELAGLGLGLPEVEHLAAVGLRVVVRGADIADRIAALAVAQGGDPVSRGLVSPVAEP